MYKLICSRRLQYILHTWKSCSLFNNGKKKTLNKIELCFSTAHEDKKKVLYKLSKYEAIKKAREKSHFIILIFTFTTRYYNMNFDRSCNNDYWSSCMIQCRATTGYRISLVSHVITVVSNTTVCSNCFRRQHFNLVVFFIETVFYQFSFKLYEVDKLICINFAFLKRDY